jgi:hypothetical protein
MALRQLLAGNRAGDGVAHEEDAQLDPVSFDERRGEAQGVVWALAAVGR